LQRFQNTWATGIRVASDAAGRRGSGTSAAKRSLRFLGDARTAVIAVMFFDNSSGTTEPRLVLADDGLRRRGMPARRDGNRLTPSAVL